MLLFHDIGRLFICSWSPAERRTEVVVKSEINKQIGKALGFTPLRVVTILGAEIVSTESKWKYPDQYSDIANGAPQYLPDFVSMFEKFCEASRSKRFDIRKDENSRPVDTDF